MTPLALDSSRPLFWPLCISLGVHAVLLVGVVPVIRLSADVAPGVINVFVGRGERARLSRGSAAPTVLTAPALNAPAMPGAERPSAASARAGVLATPERMSAAQPITRTPDLPAGEVTPKAPISGAAADAVPVPGREAGRELASASGGVAGMNGGGGGGGSTSADDLRSYRIALASAAKRFKRYPLVARERGWEGVVELDVRLTAALPAPDVSVAKSSGRGVLDDQALDMITRAVRHTVIPEGLRGKELRIALPVRFGLDDD